MKKNIFLLALIAFLFFIGCNQNKKPDLSDPVSSGRGFIESSLKGNYDAAKDYILPDSLNLNYLDRLREFYKKMPSSEKEGLKNANIIINPTENINDSEVVINYSNTYKHIPSKIKMLRKNSEWRVDFKYTFSGNL